MRLRPAPAVPPRVRVQILQFLAKRVLQCVLLLRCEHGYLCAYWEWEDRAV
uniref:Uncharacterized protein n=1 Tax=Arundo donax TaxID=35708 RepID=A0A0A9FGD0_ARUDO